MARFLLLVQLFSFGVFLCWLSGILNPDWDLQGLRLSYRSPDQLTQQLEAVAYGIRPGDGRDDAAALQSLLADLPPQTDIVINLPIGELDFLTPLEINRSDITLQGQGAGRTIVQAHFGAETADAIVRVRPQGWLMTSEASSQPQATASPKLQNIHLRGFTLRPAELASASTAPVQIDGIVLDQVETGSLTHLAIEPGGRHPLVLNQAQNVRIEYVAAEGLPNPSGEPPQAAEPKTSALPSLSLLLSSVTGGE